MNFAIWIIAVAGSALILTQSAIVAPLRNWLEAKADGGARARDRFLASDPAYPHATWVMTDAYIGIFRAMSKLVRCPMCSGFWLGALWTRVLLASPWVGSAHPRLSAALWLFVGGCGGSIISAVGVATWLFLDEAKMALGLWRYLKTPKEEPVAPVIRIPRYMRAALFNKTESPIVCACGDTISPTDKCSAWHFVDDRCGVLRANAITPLLGTAPAYGNMTAMVVVCGCGATVTSGEAHIITDRCAGTTSLDL